MFQLFMDFIFGFFDGIFNYMYVFINSMEEYDYDFWFLNLSNYSIKLKFFPLRLKFNVDI